MQRTEDEVKFLVETEMDIIFFSLYCLCKSAFHFIMANSNDNEKGEKVAFFTFLILEASICR